MKLNKNGKPRKTFALAVSIAKDKKEKAWDHILYWAEREEKWRAEKDNPEHADHYQDVVESLANSWDQWHGVVRVLRALEAIENA